MQEVYMNARIKGQLEVLSQIESINKDLKIAVSNNANLDAFHLCERLTSMYMCLDTDTLIEALLKSEGITASQKAS
jgi:hypothetical protein